MKDRNRTLLCVTGISFILSAVLILLVITTVSATSDEPFSMSIIRCMSCIIKLPSKINRVKWIDCFGNGEYEGHCMHNYTFNLLVSSLLCGASFVGITLLGIAFVDVIYTRANQQQKFE